MESTENKSWLERMQYKYRLIIMNEDTYEEHFSYRLSQLNIYAVFSTIFVLATLFTVTLIVFTPLKEYIPGYGDMDVRRKINNLDYLSDSLSEKVVKQSAFIANIKYIMGDKDLEYAKSTRTEESNIQENKIKLSDTINLDFVSSAELELRREMEQKANYEFINDILTEEEMENIEDVFFIAPLTGLVTDHFDPDKEHFGIDVVAPENEPIKAVTDGRVILSTWTMDTGYVIAIQHKHNVVTFYKHNSVLLKEVGDVVKGGEAIAIIGGSGEESTGPHLHFELWYQQAPVDPAKYIAFN